MHNAATGAILPAALCPPGKDHSQHIRVIKKMLVFQITCLHPMSNACPGCALLWVGQACVEDRGPWLDQLQQDITWR